MLKPLVLWGKFVLAISIAVGAITLMTYGEHEATDKYQRDCQSHISSIPPTRGNNNANNADECHDPKKYMPWWYVLITWPDGITTWALLATLGAIMWQSGETRKAAEATQRGIEINIAAQRAWVVIRSGMEDMREVYTPNGQESPGFWWIIKNYGTTPAQIIETQCRYKLVETFDHSKLPRPDYPDPILVNGAILIPKEPMYYSRFLEIPSERGKLEVVRRFSDDQIRALKEGTLYLLAYGYVKYRDGVSVEIRESRFVAYYAWRTSGRQAWEVGFRPVIGAPAEYTKCT